MSLLKKWKKFKYIRPFIEDVLKVGKSIGLKELHRYTKRSVYKYTLLMSF